MDRVNSRKSENGYGPIAFFIQLAVVAICAWVWIFHLRPFVIEQKVFLANQKFEFNKFDEADLLYKELLKKIPKEQKQMIEDHIAQIPFAKKYIGDLALEDKAIQISALEAIASKIGLLFIHYEIQNNGTEPLPIRRSLFYLKSLLGKCEVALDRHQNIEVDSWNGDLMPGEKAEGGICVKYMLVNPEEKIYLVYNNGKNYVNVNIPIDRYFGQTDKNQFRDGWLGKKVKAEKVLEPHVEPNVKKEGPEIQMAQKPAEQSLAAKKMDVSKPKEQKVVPGMYRDEQNGFSIQIPQGWEKVDASRINTESFLRYVPYIAAFKGPEWKGNFPMIMIQKITFPLASSITFDSKLLNEMERDVRRSFQYQGIRIQQIRGRTILMGNTQVAEIDLTFDFQKQSFHMIGYILEGKTGFILSYIALGQDFNANSNPAVQAIRSFQIEKSN